MGIAVILIELMIAGLFIVLLSIIFVYRNKIKFAQLAQKNSSELLNNLAEGVYRSSLDGKQLSANPALFRLNGYASEQEQLDSVKDIAEEWYVQPERREEFSRLLKEHGRVSNFVSEIYRHKTRERIWISENARIVYNPKTGNPTHYEGTVRDITDTIERKNSETFLATIANNLPSGLFQLVKSPEGQFSFSYASERFREMGKFSLDEKIHPNYYLKLIYPDDAENFLLDLERSAQNCSTLKSEFRFKNGDGDYHWMRISASCEQKPDGAIVWHGSITDINNWKIDQAKIEELAYYDNLTGLTNRTRFNAEVTDQLKQGSERTQYYAICFVDLDNFKLLNDTYGHEFGDSLLKTVASRLKEAIRSQDIIGRFGGDEFVICLNKLGHNELEAERLAVDQAEKLLNEFRQGFIIEDIDLSLSLSIGIVMFDDKSKIEISDLIKCADVAMYDAKKTGRDNFYFHNVKSQKSINDAYHLQKDIQNAENSNQFELEFQPQVSQDGKIYSAEALIRWNHPERGRIMPLDFIPLAERTSQIDVVNNWVIEESIRVLKEWSMTPGMDQIRLSVNISPGQLLDNKFGPRLETLLEKNHVDPSRIMIELTEHAMAREPEVVAECMHALKKSGIGFSLDDFGTGYSSLSQLKQFPFDELKIDGTFISEITHDEDAMAIVSTIIKMAKALKMQTVAEHVTEDEQFSGLCSQNCNLFQGYLFSRPLSKRDFETFVMAHSVPNNVLPNQVILNV